MLLLIRFIGDVVAENVVDLRAHRTAKGLIQLPPNEPPAPNSAPISVQTSAPTSALSELTVPASLRSISPIDRLYYHERRRAYDSANFIEVKQIELARGSAHVVGVDCHFSRSAMKVLRELVEEDLDRIIVQTLESNAPEVSFLRGVAQFHGIEFIELRGSPFHPATAYMADILPGDAIAAAYQTYSDDPELDLQRYAAMIRDGYGIDPDFLLGTGIKVFIDPLFKNPKTTARLEELYSGLIAAANLQLVHQLQRYGDLRGSTLAVMYGENMNIFENLGEINKNLNSLAPEDSSALLGTTSRLIEGQIEPQALDGNDSYRLMDRNSAFMLLLEEAAKNQSDPTSERSELLRHNFHNLIVDAFDLGFVEIAAEYAEMVINLNFIEKARGKSLFLKFATELFRDAIDDVDIKRARSVAEWTKRVVPEEGSAMLKEVALFKKFVIGLEHERDLDQAIEAAYRLEEIKPGAYSHHLRRALLLRLEHNVANNLETLATYDAQRLRVLGVPNALELPNSPPQLQRMLEEYLY